MVKIATRRDVVAACGRPLTVPPGVADAIMAGTALASVMLTVFGAALGWW